MQALLIRADNDERLGLWARAEVVERAMRIFDHRRLPIWVRDDPAYWNTRKVTEVTLTHLTGAGPPLVHWPGPGADPATVRM